MKFQLHDFKKGEYPLAIWFQQMVDAIRRLGNLKVSEGSGLTLTESAAGLTLGLSPKAMTRYALTTSIIPKYTSGAPGKGTATLQVTSYNATGVASNDPLDPTAVTVYNAGNADIPSGRRVMVTLISDRWHVVADFCP